jgi:hypothetical protein
MTLALDIGSGSKRKERGRNGDGDDVKEEGADYA